MEVPGVETIQGLVGLPPMRIELSYDLVKVGEQVRQVWNAKHMAFLPYCFACKEPLIWILEEPLNPTKFKCPKCGRVWVRDSDWDRKVQDDKKTKAL